MTDQRFGYKGQVNLSIKHGNHITRLTKHNAGCDWLFKAFAKFMSGNATGSDSEIPKFFDLRASSDQGTTWVSVLGREVKLSSRYFEYDSTLGWVARLTGQIVYDDLLQYISDADARQFRLYMYSDADESPGNTDKYHDVAYINLGADTLSNISPGVTLIVEWTMRLVNA